MKKGLDFDELFIIFATMANILFCCFLILVVLDCGVGGFLSIVSLWLSVGSILGLLVGLLTLNRNLTYEQHSRYDKIVIISCVVVIINILLVSFGIVW